MQPRTDIEEQLTLHDGKESRAVIQYLGPNEPNVGLGFRLCPTGNQAPHFEATLGKITDLCKAASTAYLTETEARQLIYQRLEPKLAYALHGTSFTLKQCKQVNTIIRKTFLPLLCLNRNFPSAVLYGPLDYGGMEFIETYTLQDQVQLDYLIKQLRWDKVVSNDFLVTLDSVQMFSGFTAPILEFVHDKIDFIPPSYIISLRDRLREMKAFLWIEKSWSPQLQREGDSSIMNTFVRCPNITRAMLRQVNAVRIYMRVAMIADLTDVGGTFIPSGMLTGEWTAGTDLQWPYQPKPPPTFWSVFQKCLRLTFCTNTPPYSRPHHSLALDKPLGNWYNVKRNTWFQVYKSTTDVFWRKEETGYIHKMRRSGVSCFHRPSTRVSTLPLDCHPIRFKQMGETIWTHGKFRGILTSLPTTPPGHIIENSLITDDTDLVMLGSDGSVHLSEGLVACAWIIYQSEMQQLKACYVLENTTSISSYRSELEGMYRGLLDVNIHLKPIGIRQWCDNEAAVKKYNTDLYTPSQMIKADADIILAIKHARGKLEHTESVICKNVYGHQDSTKCRR